MAVHVPAYGGGLMVATRSAVPPLQLEWPPWRHPGRGVVAVVREAELTSGWSRSLLAREAGLLHVWAPDGGDLEARGLEVTHRPGVVAATLAREGSDPRHLWLALWVARQLAAQRKLAGTGLSHPPLTSWSAPDPPPGTVRVPYLVTVRHGPGLATDAVVWEVLDVEDAQRWLGTRDLEFVEANLDALVRLHKRVRLRTLPPTTAAARLLMMLGPDQELQTPLVLQLLTFSRPASRH